MTADAWVFMALIAFGVVTGVVMYGLGFLHGRDVERDKWSPQRRANRVLGSGPGPRVMRP